MGGLCVPVNDGSRLLVSRAGSSPRRAVHTTERVTLDYDLKFSSSHTGESLHLPGIAIAEIKYEGFLSGSPMHAAMRITKINPRRFSKYAIGMALLHTDLKQNRFKRRVRKVHQINDEYHLTTKLS